MSELSELFRQMAERIEKVGDDEFGGALLVVPPPDQSGQNHAIEVLLIDPKRDPANYWAMATSKIQTAAAVFEEKARAMDQQRFR